jgi:beta-glucosidase
MPETWFRRPRFRGLSARRAGARAGKALTAACAIGLVAAIPVVRAPEQASAASTTAVDTAAAAPPACPIAGSSAAPLYLDTSYSFAERAADLVSCMTLSEKVQQLHTNNAPAIPRVSWRL